jgi:hypothetical protein
MHLILDIDATLADVGNASVDPPKDGSPPWWLNADVLALMQPLRPVWWAVEGLLNKYATPPRCTGGTGSSSSRPPTRAT